MYVYIIINQTDPPPPPEFLPFLPDRSVDRLTILIITSIHLALYINVNCYVQLMKDFRGIK